MENNKYIWNLVKQPPKTALKVIGAGRLKGKSDINPQWRYEVMTEVFGMCGDGWKYTIDKKWTELAPYDQIFAFVDITLYVKAGSQWSEGIPATGGSMLVTLESKTDFTTKEKKEILYANDEAYKMAVTDALGTAMKMIGVAADIYAGKWDGSKYINQDIKPETKQPPNKEPDVPEFTPDEYITLEQQTTINGIIIDKDVDRDAFLKFMVAMSVPEIKLNDYDKALQVLKQARGRKAA